jgi:hypothetical protein
MNDLNASDDEPDLAIGKTIEEALKITRNEVAESLEGLPPVKMHCSNLAADALHAAIEDYLKKEGRGEWLNGTKKSTKKKSGKKRARVGGGPPSAAYHYSPCLYHYSPNLRLFLPK